MKSAINTPLLAAGCFISVRSRSVFALSIALAFGALAVHTPGFQTFTRFLVPLERAGGVLWRKVLPFSRHLLPARTVGQAFTVGIIWGWLPCGMVYSALATALTTGSIRGGAYVMLAFGLGTLPNLLLAGLMAARLRAITSQPGVRYADGMAVILFGIYGGWKALQKIIG